MARIIFNYESNKYSFATWLKIEFYSLFFTALPHLIAAFIWVVILATILWSVTLI